MGKNKLQRYAENKELENVIEHGAFGEDDFSHKGRWAQEVFGNKNPIIVELACGKGEYTTSLAERFPNKNFIGIDIKGDRIWKGAKRAIEQNLDNVRFLRCFIDHLDQYFSKGEIHEFWITFPDPFLKKSDAKKRLTSPKFLSIYRKIAEESATVHLKTDSEQLFRFTEWVIENQQLPVIRRFDDLYGEGPADELLSIKTYYEKKHLAAGRKIHFISFSLTS
ncbi:MAG: tRNA (guanosine(46)-N7)-methyltransferase TrmB [Bacteroidetes bacterium]|nr:tRNA (guanosine(46)-N7)-methyltransferase TrmB [Bacteroidota bacterium]